MRSRALERTATPPLTDGAPGRPSVAVVVCAYTTERWADLVAALASLAAQDPSPDQIILVTDHNHELANRARAELPDVCVIENQSRKGLSGARNTGLAHSTADVVAFLDDDAVALPGWLDALSSAYADPTVVGVGGAAIPVWPGPAPRWLPDEFCWVIGCSWIGLPEAPAGVRNLIGCNMSFRREVFDEIGAFTLGIGRVGKRPVGCEETELCIRLHQHRPDALILYDPRVRVLHKVSSDRRRWSYFRARCYAEGLSKALVAGRVGSSDGLASERSYVLRTLPLGVVRGCSEGLRGRDPAGFARAGAIVAGLAITATGYARGRWMPAGSAATESGTAESVGAAPAEVA
ncbi:MAG: glycosyltransferase family 2 protein [Acidimicrobiia bacterium]